ncbi:MAG: hypothetical protein D6813_00545, partial [Calditrichaeota bacterium]
EEDQNDYGHLPGKKENLIVDLTTRGRAFVKLLENEKMLKVFSYFLGNDCILYSYTSSILRPDDSPDAAQIHTDSKKFEYIPGYHFGLIMNLALDDFTEENGATYYLPGSHKIKEKPNEEEFYKNSVRAIRNAGDAIFFHPLCWHAAGKNLTKKTRYAVTVYACRSFIKQRLDFPRMVNSEILSWIGERGRQFLGFNSRVPTNLYEFYVPEEKRLYKILQ